MQEQHRVGIDYLEAVTALLQRVRTAHPTKGSYEAAEIQWWWSIQRSTDNLPQLFWFDESGRPEAAVTVTDFGDGSSAVYEDPTLVVIVMPDATPDWVEHVVERGLAYLTELGIRAVELEVDRADDVMRAVLFGHGFKIHPGFRLSGSPYLARRPADDSTVRFPRNPGLCQRLLSDTGYLACSTQPAQ